MPNLVAAGTRELNTSIIAIVKATKGAQVAIDQLGAGAEKRLGEAGAREREALEQTARQVLEGLRRAQAGQQARSAWVVVALGLGLFLVSAAGAYVGVTLAR